MYIPKKTKFKKQQKKISFKKVKKPFGIDKLKFGSVGLKSVSVGRLTSKQIESIYQLLKKRLKRVGQVFITIFPNSSITKKPIEVRMGKGKGNVSFWISKIKCGTVLCEIETSELLLAVNALKVVQYCLPVKTQIIFN